MNEKDFQKLKIQEALEFLLHLNSAHIRVRRGNENGGKRAVGTSDTSSSNVVKIQLARPNLFETFGFTVKSLIEDDMFKKLMVTR